MFLSEESPPSRWQLFLEARDTLRQTLAPALPLAHLLTHGPRLAIKTRVRRPKRPPQIVHLAKMTRQN